MHLMNVQRQNIVWLYTANFEFQRDHWKEYKKCMPYEQFLVNDVCTRKKTIKKQTNKKSAMGHSGSPRGSTLLSLRHFMWYSNLPNLKFYSPEKMFFSCAKILHFTGRSCLATWAHWPLADHMCVHVCAFLWSVLVICTVLALFYCPVFL